MAAAESDYAPVIAGHPLRFPEDLGSHPQFRTEWWYVTGWLLTERGESLGFQITFFRTKPNIDANNPSDFAPRQIMVAHCALSDPQRGTLWQDQKIRRAALGLAGAAAGSSHVWNDRWSLKREVRNRLPKIGAEGFSCDRGLAETLPKRIKGEGG